jgi:hypothetical protein
MTEKEQLNLALIVKHKEQVAVMLAKFSAELAYRAAVHDNSKFNSTEFDDCSENVLEFNKYPFGTPEYDALREKLKNAIVYHRERNRHHPEHFENGIDGMNLIDILEMLVDWKSASTRSPEDSLRKGLPLLKEKYNISPQLLKILENTAKDFNMY